MRTTRKWIEVAVPVCPVCGIAMFLDDLERDEHEASNVHHINPNVGPDLSCAAPSSRVALQTRCGDCRGFVNRWEPCGRCASTAHVPVQAVEAAANGMPF